MTSQSRRPLFQFRLRAVDDIAAWGAPPKQTLSWFGLTDGWYWLNVGDDELFRARSSHADPAYVDYQVVRLWEDVLDMLPAILARVPGDVATHLSAEKWPILREKALAWSREHSSFLDIELALRWAFERQLDVGYLVAGPQISFWTTEDTTHVSWNNRECLTDGKPSWSALSGETSMSTEDFIREVRDFDARLLSEMAERVREARTSWSRSEVTIDLDHLQHEQEDRATWLERALAKVRARPPEDWEKIRDALRAISSA